MFFLIEVKIADSAAHATDNKKNKEGQLIQQVNNSRKVLKELLKDKDNFDINNDISIIFVTPDIIDKSKFRSKVITNAKTAFKEILEDERDFKNNPKIINLLEFN
jgi:cytochrome c556